MSGKRPIVRCKVEPGGSLKITLDRKSLGREFDVWQIVDAGGQERKKIDDRMKELGLEYATDRKYIFDVCSEYKKKEEREEKKGKKKSDEPILIKTSFYEKDGVMYEEIFDGERAFFARSDTGKQLKEIDEGFRIIQPIDDAEVFIGAVLLPSKAEKYGSAEDLVRDIREFSEDYLDIPDDYRTFASHYPLLSTVQDKVNNVPYLRTLGDTGTGKSRFIDTFGRLCYKPIIMAGSVGAAPIFRLQGKWKGTICIEEADRKNSSETDDVITALNCGFERGRPFPRCDKNDPNKVEFFDVFGCKVLGSRFRFKDKALESRCLTTVMLETERKDIPATLPDKFFERQQGLRNKLLSFRFDYRSKISSDSIQRIDLGDIEMRLKQMASPFAVLFEPMPALFLKFKTFIWGYNQELIEERSGTPEGFIIRALADFEDQPSISSTNLSQRLSEEYQQDVKEFSARKVGSILKSLGVKRKDKRTEQGVRKCILWDKSLMKKLKRKYIPDGVKAEKSSKKKGKINNKKSELHSATHATLATNATKGNKPVASVSTVAVVSSEPEGFSFIKEPKTAICEYCGQYSFIRHFDKEERLICGDCLKGEMSR